MQALILFFAELCALRRAPQDLPASDALLLLTLIADALTGWLVGVTAGLSWWASLVQSLSELALMLGALYVALTVLGHPARFIQSASALLGSSALIGLVALIPLGLDRAAAGNGDLAALGALLFLALVIWNLVVTGHILRHTFELTLGQGAALAVAFELFSVAIIGILFGGV